MTDTDFIFWRTQLGLSRSQAADVLGIGINQPKRYEEGQKIPRYIALACAAVAQGVPPIGASNGA